MAEPVKYQFDRAFDGGAKSRREAELADLAQQAQSKAAQAYAEGMEAGRNEVRTGFEAAALEHIARIESAMHALFQQREALERETQRAMTALSYTIGAALAPALMRAFPTYELEDIIKDAVEAADNEPRLLVRVHPSILDSIAAALEKIKANTAYSGELILVDEPSFSPHDIRIEWPNGGAEKLTARIQARVQAAVQRFIGADDLTMDQMVSPAELEDADAGASRAHTPPPAEVMPQPTPPMSPMSPTPEHDISHTNAEAARSGAHHTPPGATPEDTAAPTQGDAFSPSSPPDISAETEPAPKASHEPQPAKPKTSADNFEFGLDVRPIEPTIIE